MENINKDKYLRKVGKKTNEPFIINLPIFQFQCTKTDQIETVKTQNKQFTVIY